MTAKRVRSESPAPYLVTPAVQDEQSVINCALVILERRLGKTKNVLSTPEDVRNYLRLSTATLEHEVFGCLFLDNQHGVIGAPEEMFRGTIDGASVYPREVVKRCLQLNAAAVIFYHNHPSGVPEPSQADQRLTQRLKAALGTVDIRVLDHFVVGGMDIVSFAERGLL